MKLLQERLCLVAWLNTEFAEHLQAMVERASGTGTVATGKQGGGEQLIGLFRPGLGSQRPCR